MVHQHRLHRIAVRQAQKQLARHAVAGVLLTQNLNPARQHAEALLQRRNIRLAQIMHRRKIKDRLLIKPLVNLLSTKLFHACGYE